MKVSMRLFKRKNNGVYYVEFNRDQIRSLKTKDEGEAKELYVAIREEYLAGRLEQITGKCTKSLQDFYKEYLKIGPDLEDSKKTFYANRLALRKLISIASGQIKLDKISKKHIDFLIAQCRRDNLSVASINNYIRHSKAILTRAKEWNYIKVNPLRNVRQIRTEGKKPKAIDRKAVPNFISSIEDQDLKLMVVAYLTTGRRRCELLMLEDTDFDFKINKYFVRRSKDHLSRWYPIGSGFMAVINNLKVDGKLPAGRLFKKWSHPDTISHKVKEALISCGLENHRLHDLRHTFSSIYLENKGDLKSLQELLGHSEYKTTEIYAHLSEDHLQKEVERVKIGPFDLLKREKS